MASEEMNFENIFFSNLAFWLPWQPIKLVEEYFCKTFIKIAAVR